VVYEGGGIVVLVTSAHWRCEIWSPSKPPGETTGGERVTIYFTADHHFGHANIIKHTNRPFDSLHEMNRALVE